jgi:hypothetical protein
MEEKIEKAMQILEKEGYEVNHKMSPFSIFQSYDIEQNKVKGYVRIYERSKYELDFIHITFTVAICKMCGSNELSIAENRNIANYMLHMCDVADELNGLNIVVHRDLREIKNIDKL